MANLYDLFSFTHLIKGITYGGDDVAGHLQDSGLRLKYLPQN